MFNLKFQFKIPRNNPPAISSPSNGASGPPPVQAQTRQGKEEKHRHTVTKANLI